MHSEKKYKLGILVTHPIQYYVPWYKALAAHSCIELTVYFCHRQTPKDQAEAGFGVEFDWDISLLEGYRHQFLANTAKPPSVYSVFGCDTPGIAEIIAKNNFDAFIVSGWNNKSYWQAIRTCWKNKIPVLIRGDSRLKANGLIKNLLKYPFYRYFIPRFDAYLVVGQEAKRYYLYYGADPRKFYFVPHAVDNDFFAQKQAFFLKQREELRQQWQIPKNAVIFIFAGKLIPIKRPEDFITAIKLASAKNKNVFGLITGDGPLRPGLEKRVRKGKIPVRFSGFLNQKEMPKAYAASDCLVVSSSSETWGLVVNEAMASSLPAIVSDQVGCGPDLVLPEQTGEIFPCGDIKKLAEIILNLSFKPNLLKRMGRNAKERIKNYSVSEAVRHTGEAIK